MKEQLINFETAKLAKEKGFDILCEHSFSEHDSGIQENNQNGFRNWNKEYKNSYSRPTQALLQKYLRKKRIDITVITDWKKGKRIYYVGFSFVNDKNQVDIWFSKDDDKNKIEYSDYEDALEVGLYECLQRVSETVA